MWISRERWRSSGSWRPPLSPSSSAWASTSLSPTAMASSSASPPPPPLIRGLPEGTAAASPPSHPPAITRFVIIDENVTMIDDFEIGEFDPEFVDRGTNNVTKNEGTGSEKIGV
ncbi:hypothetical protein NL676_011195 [Syzygium grande]|nr:hypothetical protein NL676_011195 [Syzygium grande]